MREALASGGLALAQTAVAHFGQAAGALVANPDDDFDYEYVLDWCVLRRHRSHDDAAIC